MTLPGGCGYSTAHLSPLMWIRTGLVDADPPWRRSGKGCLLTPILLVSICGCVTSAASHNKQYSVLPPCSIRFNFYVKNHTSDRVYLIGFYQTQSSYYLPCGVPLKSLQRLSDLILGEGVWQMSMHYFRRVIKLHAVWGHGGGGWKKVKILCAHCVVCVQYPLTNWYTVYKTSLWNDTRVVLAFIGHEQPWYFKGVEN